MHCQRCRIPGANERKEQRRARRTSGARCPRCGARLVSSAAAPAEGKVDTHVHLARFGLTITGDPLLELARRGGGG